MPEFSISNPELLSYESVVEIPSTQKETSPVLPPLMWNPPDSFLTTPACNSIKSDISDTGRFSMLSALIIADVDV